jgi:hypothetical protein
LPLVDLKAFVTRVRKISPNNEPFSDPLSL